MHRRGLDVLANDFLLLLTAAIWGFAFVAQRAGMEHVGPFTYTAVRFALGSLVLVPLVAARGRREAPATPVARAIRPVPAGLLAGAVLFGGAILQQAGLVSTTAGKAGFITGLYVVLVPLAGLAWGERAGWPRWVAAVLAAGGLYLLSVTGGLSVEPGDLLVLLGALCWTAHVLVLGWLAPRTDPIALACVQFAVCSVIAGIVAVAAEPLSVREIRAAAVPIGYGGLVSVGIAYTLQVVAQRRAPASHAAILMSLESAFAALGGWLVLGERLGPRSVAGAALMFAGMIVSQLPLLVARPWTSRQPGSP